MNRPLTGRPAALSMAALCAVLSFSPLGCIQPVAESDSDPATEEAVAAAPEALSTPPNQSLAYGKPATQSSTAYGGDPQRAVDGNTDGDYGHASVTHTDVQMRPWWKVDLGSVQAVGQVIVMNRTDCCAERLANFQLLLSNDGANWQTWVYPGIAPTRTIFRLPAGTSARYVQIQLQGMDPLSLAEVLVFPPGAGDDPVPKVQVADFTRPAAQREAYRENWMDSGRLAAMLDPADLHFAGDFKGLGHSQALHIHRERHNGFGKIKIVDYVGAAPGSGGANLYQENWNDTPLLDGWIDSNDLQLVGDFTGSGHKQIMYVNRGGSGGKVMIVDYASPQVGGQVQYLELWGQSPLLDGWLDTTLWPLQGYFDDRQLVGDFRGLGHDQVMYINRGGAGGKVMIVDYASGTPHVLYWEDWGQSPLLNGWLDTNDLQLVGDFTGAHKSQVMFVNRGQDGGKIMILDYSGSSPVSRYWEEWWQNNNIIGWIEDNDSQIVGDFMGLGRQQVLYINRGGTGGKAMVIDYGAGVLGGVIKFWDDWSQPSQLDPFLGANDRFIVGDFTGAGHAQLQSYNLDDPTTATQVCPTGQAQLADTRTCVSIRPWNHTPLAEGQSIAWMAHGARPWTQPNWVADDMQRALWMEEASPARYGGAPAVPAPVLAGQALTSQALFTAHANGIFGTTHQRLTISGPSRGYNDRDATGAMLVASPAPSSYVMLELLTPPLSTEVNPPPTGRLYAGGTPSSPSSPGALYVVKKVWDGSEVRSFSTDNQGADGTAGSARPDLYLVTPVN